MKNTIGQRIMATILAPSILVFGLLSAFIAYAASQFVTVWAKLELKSVSETSASDLAGRVQSVRISVLSAASMLDTLDSQVKDGRVHAENIIKSMFENPHVHNAWLAYEPGAFDGRDAEFTSDYPGAPSGRFIRSYVMEDGQIVTAPDMDENTLDDPEESAWYVKPRDTGRFYTDASNDTPNLYDYGLGDEPVCTMAFTSPILRDGRVIGCVGADMSFDAAAFDSGRTDQASVTVFYPNGRVFFSSDTAFADDSVDTLGFAGAPEIKASFSEGSELFLANEYSAFLNTKAFTYFRPVAVSEEDNLYLYAAIPHSSVLNGLEPLFIMISGIVAVVLMFIVFIITYVKRKISNPLKSLMLAADAVSRGDLEAEIPSFPGSKDEIGILSRSLHRMVEQFRVYILRLEQAREEAVIYSKVDELIASGDASGTTEGLLALVCGHLGVDKAMAVRLSDGSASVFLRHNYESGHIGAEVPHDSPYHAQIMPMLAGKKLLLMNAYMISEQGVDFLDKETRFACILPLRDGHRALGYVILESKNEKNPFGAKAEPILCNAAKALSDFIKNDDKKAEASGLFHMEPPGNADKTDNADENGESGLVGAFYGIEGLEPASAIQTMGGMYELYEQALKLLASLLPETIEKLDACIDSDLDEFAIEIHGLKGSLNNVGAYGFGDFASRIEQAAKSKDASLCAKLYASFRDTLTDFYRRLVKAFENESGKLPGNVLELVELLPEAEKAVSVGDCDSALNMLRSVSGFSFDLESDDLLGEILSALEASEAGKASEGIRKLRERLTNWEEA